MEEDSMQGFGYIYKTTNLINGKLYIGQKQGVFAADYLGSGWMLSKALQKYGKQNFRLDVIAYANNRESLDELEIKYIAQYRETFGRDFLYNITAGGHGVRRPCPKATKKNISVAVKEAMNAPEMKKLLRKIAQERFSIPENNVMFGKKHSKETRNKISKAHMGKDYLKGIPKSEEHKEKLRQKALGRGHTLETRKKMSHSHTGLKRSPEECLAIKKRVTTWWKQKKTSKIMESKGAPAREAFSMVSPGHNHGEIQCGR